MMRICLIFLILASLFVASPLLAQDGWGLSESGSSTWDIAALDTARHVDYLTEFEKDLVLEHNKLRTNPALFAETYLFPLLDDFNGLLQSRPGRATLRTNEGARAVREAIQDLQTQRPLNPLMPSRGLSAAAADHAEDQSRSGRTGHRGGDGSTMTNRIDRYGRWDLRIGENIAYGPEDGREAIIQLVVDDGVPSRGHRRNMLSRDFGFLGVAQRTHSVYGTVAVLDYAGRFAESQD